jgi:hypothetical protein
MFSIILTTKGLSYNNSVMFYEVFQICKFFEVFIIFFEVFQI